MRDEPRRRKMAEAARRQVEEHFSWTAIAKKTADLYGEVGAARENGAP
jgi:glycosyltransferase involved in cell wall biosynthesis